MTNLSNDYPYLDRRGRKLIQSEIKQDMQRMLAGQSYFSRGVIFCFALLLMCFASMILGYFGAQVFFGVGIGLTIPVKKPYVIEFLVVAIAITVSLLIREKKGLIYAVAATILLDLVGVPILSRILFNSYSHHPDQMMDLITSTAAISLMYGLVVLSVVLLLQLSFLVAQYLFSFRIRSPLFVYVFSISMGAWIAYICFINGRLNIEDISPKNLKESSFYLVLSASILGAAMIETYSAWSVLNIVKEVNSSTASSHARTLGNWSRNLASFGGTSFLNLDLSGTNLSGSKIANSDFRASKLYRTSLREVKGLQYARVDDRYLDLDRPQVQELLTTGQSRDPNFRRVTLRGAYLQDANLQELDFTEANLDGADCRNADLRRAIFIRTIATDVDFTNADLTGCCIKDWSTNRQTIFTGITCDYIYRDYAEGRPQDRYPRDRNFEPGEFESVLNRVETSYEMVIHDRIDPLALSFTLQQFQLDDNGLGLTLEGLEQRGDNWIVKIGYQEGISSQQVTTEVTQTYEDLRSLFETRYQLALQAKESEITRLNQMMTDAMQRFVNRTSGNVTIRGEGHRVYIADKLENVMESQNISVGGSIGGNLVAGDVTASNLGTMTGNLTATIQTLRSSDEPETQDLAQLIETLTAAITEEAALSNEQKQEALEAVSTLAEEGQKKSETRVTKLCTMAVNALKGIRTSVSDASNLATVLQTTLPLVKVFLGLP